MMLRNKPIMRILILTGLVLLMAGCYKDKTVYFETGEEITRVVSFANDIVPIFNSSCNISGCHSPGGKAPDLSASNAFNSLSGGGFLSPGDPTSSVLYQWMTGKKGTPMPVSGMNKDYNSLVQAWLKQGANNN
jgi:hypothetical protein